MQIRGIVQGKNQLIVANDLNVGIMNQPKLVFQRYENSHFLTEIFLENGQWGFSLQPSQRQQIKKETNLALAAHETIEINAAKTK